jgi:ABC-2 type transport system permease protein
VSPGAAIARLEWTRTRRDPVMAAMLALFALLSAYAIWSGTRWAERRGEAVVQAVAEADKTMALRRESFAKMVAEGEKPGFGLIYATALPFRAGLPSAPLASLSAGQAEGYPAAASISPFLDPYTIFDAHMTGLESAAVLSAGRFDLSFVIVVLLPLLLIAATYDFWSRDVESGAARFQLAQPVGPTRLILTRAALRGGVLLIGAVLIATLALSIAGGTNDPGGLATFALVALAYGAVWIGVAILINLFVRASTTAALTAGTAWLAIVLLLPAGLSAAANLAAPPPSPLTYTNAVRSVGLQVRASNAEAAKRAADAKSGRAYPATLWHSRREIAERDARLLPLHHGYAAAQARHRDVATALSFLSPAVIAQDAFDRLAGTDPARALAFQEQSRRFAARTRALAFDWMDRDRLLTLADYDGGLPRFAFREPSRGRALTIDLLVLLGTVAALITFAVLRMRSGVVNLV